MFGGLKDFKDIKTTIQKDIEKELVLREIFQAGEGFG